MNLPQVVPSEYCLRCRGCCVFLAPKGPWPRSEWRPRLLCEEEIALERREPGVSSGGSVRAAPCGDGRERCVCLNADDHHCRIYASRPFECALYPFLFSSEHGTLKLYVHSACPFVGEKRASPEWAGLVEAVRAGLRDAGLLNAAAAAFPDYSRFSGEVEFVADIPFHDGTAALLARKAWLDAWFARRRPALSAASFTSVFSWAHLFAMDIEEADGNALVFARANGEEFLYCPPLGERISPAAVARAFGRMKGGAARIEAVPSADLPAFDDSRYRIQIQGEEYYYERARIASLAGNGYRSKRSDLNGFLRRHSPVFRCFVPADAQACHDLFDRWLDNRRASYEDDIYRAMLVENRQVHRRLIAHAAQLGLVGRVVEAGGTLAGYTFGYALNQDTFCVALEVTDPAFRGLPVFIFREFCADEQVKHFKFINAMDDLGMPGVARAKRSWRPAFMEKAHSVCSRP